jgi:hypothetical protein
MANIKKARFPAELLPAIGSSTGGYLFRFRVVSQDKNRKSAWSPTYNVSPEYDYVVGEIGHFSSGNILSISWEPAQIFISDSFVRDADGYDIWISWNNGSFQYRATTTSTSYNVAMPSGTTSYSIKIYHRSSPPAQVESLLLYTVPNTTI